MLLARAESLHDLRSKDCINPLCPPSGMGGVPRPHPPFLRLCPLKDRLVHVWFVGRGPKGRDVDHGPWSGPSFPLGQAPSARGSDPTHGVQRHRNPPLAAAISTISTCSVNANQSPLWGEVGMMGLRAVLSATEGPFLQNGAAVTFCFHSRPCPLMTREWCLLASFVIFIYLLL